LNAPGVQAKALRLRTENVRQCHRLSLAGGQERLTASTNLQALDVVGAQVVEETCSVSPRHFNLSRIGTIKQGRPDSSRAVLADWVAIIHGDQAALIVLKSGA
jgi:hypothetical protein